MNIYQKHPDYGYPVLKPWKGQYEPIFEAIKSLTLLTKDRVYYLLALSAHGINMEGEFAECGVWRGGSALALAHQITTSGAQKTLYLFDRFEDTESLLSPKTKSSEASRVSFGKVAEILSPFGFVRIIKGEIPSVLEKARSTTFSFVHIDLNEYTSTRDATGFFYERMNKGSVMLFDDYGFPTYAESVKKAVDEFFGGEKEEPIVLSTGQCFVIKL